MRAGGTPLFYNRKHIKATPLEWIAHEMNLLQIGGSSGAGFGITFIRRYLVYG